MYWPVEDIARLVKFDNEVVPDVVTPFMDAIVRLLICDQIAPKSCDIYTLLLVMAIWKFPDADMQMRINTPVIPFTLLNLGTSEEDR